MKHYYLARIWDDESTIEMLETSSMPHAEYVGALQRKYPTRTIVVDEMDLREFLFLGRKLEGSKEERNCNADNIGAYAI